MRDERTTTRQVAETGDHPPSCHAMTLSEEGIIVEAELGAAPKSYRRRSSAASFMGWSNAAKATMPAARG